MENKKTLTLNANHLLCSCLLFGLFSADFFGKVYKPLIYGFSGRIIHFFYLISTLVLVVMALSGHSQQWRTRRRWAGQYFRWQILLPLAVLVTAPLYSLWSQPIEEFGLSYWSRWLSEFLFRGCMLVSAWCLFVILGEKTMDLLTRTLLIISGILLILAFLRFGPGQVLRVPLVVVKLLPESRASQFLETNHISFTLGICYLYSYFQGEKTPAARFSRFLSLIVLFLAGKRIGLFAIVFSLLLGFLVKKRGLSKKLVITVGICGVVLCLIYLNEIYNNSIISLLNEHNISWSGRDAVFQYFTRRSRFDPGFLGWGQGATSKMLENMSYREVGNMVVFRGLHNDILKRYLDWGFLGFIGWAWYNLLFLPKKVFHMYGKKAATLFLVLLTYSFITYLTDNTEGYFVFQVALMGAALVYAYSQEQRRISGGE